MANRTLSRCHTVLHSSLPSIRRGVEPQAPRPFQLTEKGSGVGDWGVGGWARGLMSLWGLRSGAAVHNMSLRILGTQWPQVLTDGQRVIAS